VERVAGCGLNAVYFMQYVASEGRALIRKVARGRGTTSLGTEKENRRGREKSHGGSLECSLESLNTSPFLNFPAETLKIRYSCSGAFALRGFHGDMIWLAHQIDVKGTLMEKLPEG
jgi:hypothetical protein